MFAIKRENSNWPVAFRYDLAVQTAVMTFRLPDGSVANPALRDSRLEREAVRETERMKDFLPAFKELNPYADGEIKAFVDPISGIDNRVSHSATHAYSKPTPRSQSFSQQGNFSGSPVYNGPGGSGSNTWSDRRPEFRNHTQRGRRGSWNGNQGGRDRSPNRRKFNGNGESYRRDDRRERMDDRENVGTTGKAK